MDGEDRERKMIEDQIARAREAAGADAEVPKELARPEGEKIKLSLSLAPKKAEGTPEAEASGSGTPEPPKISFGTFGKSPAVNPLKAAGSNPLKRAAPTNVFKAAKSAKTEEPAKPKGFVSEAERLMREDMARKAGRGGYQGAGPRRGDARR